MPVILGKKIGMTQIVDPAGRLISVTAIQAGPATVTCVRTRAQDGYEAVQLGLGDVKNKHLTKSDQGQFAKSKLPARKHLREFRLDRPGDGGKGKPEYKLGQILGSDIFEEGQFVDIQGQTIGKGFQGVVRRWGQHGGPDSHGSMHHRRLGSAGASSFPSRTWRGFHMPGHMGDRRRTIQNLLVMKVMKEDHVILVKGSVPGKRNSLLAITKSFKRDKIDFAELAKLRTKGQTTAKAKKPVKKVKK